jgi:hypothetical protein
VTSITVRRVRPANRCSAHAFAPVWDQNVSSSHRAPTTVTCGLPSSLTVDSQVLREFTASGAGADPAASFATTAAQSTGGSPSTPEGLRLADQLDDRVAQCHLLGALACFAAGRGEHRRAAQRLGAADGVRAEAGASIHVGLAPALHQADRSVTAALGPQLRVGFRRRTTADPSGRVAARAA